MALSPFLVEIARYILDCSAKGLSKKTLSSYEQTLKLFARYLEDIFEVNDVKSVTGEHVKAYIRSIEERGQV
ncbi:site-specific integrase [Solibacillus cecembensis]|uniref:site-specific integrase n=1 Tax=Solibacillus cecembensis TaxID=459347 RepID=UPI000716FBD9